METTIKMAYDFNKLLTDAQPKMKKWAVYFTKNEDDAQDLLQDTNIHILCRQEKYIHTGNFLAWAAKIMRHYFYGQKKQKFTEIKDVFIEDIEVESEMPATPHMTEIVNALLEVNKTVRRRKFQDPEVLGEIWRDKFIHKMKVKDIATKYGEKQGTISSLLYQRGRLSQNKLQQLLLLKEKG